jgi:hypothetical protein
MGIPRGLLRLRGIFLRSISANIRKNIPNILKKMLEYVEKPVDIFLKCV